jgi:hypothetical protein
MHASASSEEIFHPVHINANDHRLARYVFETNNQVDGTVRKYCIYAEPDEYCKTLLRITNIGHGGRIFYIKLQQNNHTTKYVKTSNLWKFQDVQWPKPDPELKYADHHVYQGRFVSADLTFCTPPRQSSIPLDDEGWGWHNAMTPWLSSQTAKTAFRKECAHNDMEVYRIRESIKANKVLCYCNDDAVVIATDKKQTQGATLGCEDRVCKFQTFVFDPLHAPPSTKANITPAEAQEQLEAASNKPSGATRKRRKSIKHKILSRGWKKSSTFRKQY